MRNIVIAAAIGALAFCSGCATERFGSSSSLVDFLYPNGDKPPLEHSKPKLQLPLRVGVAFVPTNRFDSALPESRKYELLEGVRDEFQDRSFVEHIELIPESYLRGGSGFETLSQVGRVYDLDVVALVSYDQAGTTTRRQGSILYWTIVGAYFIKGDENSVNTFIDTAVFDLRTESLLFRAAGTDRTVSSTALVNVEKDRIRTESKSFDHAADSMKTNLALELDRFRTRVRETNEVDLVDRNTGRAWRMSGGGGSSDLVWVMVLLGFYACAHLRLRR